MLKILEPKSWNLPNSNAPELLALSTHAQYTLYVSADIMTSQDYPCLDSMSTY